jgi:hypothetical protein
MPVALRLAALAQGSWHGTLAQTVKDPNWV